MTQVSTNKPENPLFAAALKVAPDMKGVWKNFGKDGVSFDQGAEELMAAHRLNGGDITDRAITDLRTWLIGERDGQIVLANPNTRENYALRRTGFSGLMESLDIKAGGGDVFLNRLPPALQTHSLNAAIQRYTGKLNVNLRIRDQEVVAIVSPKYAPVDTPDMLAMARDALVKQDMLHDARIMSVCSGGRDVVRLRFPERDVEIKKGDIIARGVDFRNGSWGGSAVSLESLTVRLVCLNGMTTSDSNGSWSFNHVGTKERIQQKLVDALPLALNEGGNMIDRFRDALGKDIENLSKFMLTATRAGVQDGEWQRVHEQLKQEMEVPVIEQKLAVPLFHAINALTATARDLDPERRIFVERVAGTMLYRRTGNSDAE